MTPEALELLRLRMKSHAKDVLLQWLIRRAAIAEGLQPADFRVQLFSAADQDLNRLQQEFLQLTFARLSAAESDLLAAEAQEAFEAELQTVRSSLAVLGVK